MPPTRTYRFADVRFDPRTGDVQRDGHPPGRLAPKAALVLRMLVEARGELVTREALRERIWPDTVVEYDKGLNFLVREVRAALGDAASDPTFVETLPRRGYRFLPAVEVVGGGSGQGSRSTPAVAGAAAGGLAVAALLVALIVPPGTPEPDPRAREVAEMGGYLLTRGEGDDVARSVDFFREALALDPDYGRAYAGLGSAYLRLSRVQEGKAALARSLELDPAQWAPRLTLALRALYVEYDRPAARHHFEATLERAPGEVAVRHAYAWSRAVDGDLDAAVRHMRAALEIDPVSPRVNGDVGRLFYLAGRHDQAVAQCERTAGLTPGALRPRDCVVQALVEKGALEEARTAAAEAAGALGAPAAVAVAIGNGPAGVGLDAYWRWVAPAIEARAGRGEDSHVHAAAAWARLGDADRAFRALEAAYAVRCPVLPQIGLDPALAALRGDPRFREMEARVGGSGAPLRAPPSAGTGPRRPPTT